MNIFSGSGGLGSALTNPTELARRKRKLDRSYRVHFLGATYDDAESAYQVYKTGQTSVDDDTMANIIMEKFIQHPELFNEVRQLGGVKMLEKCNHFTGAKSAAFKLWEGKGLESRFIRNLVEGYKRALNATPRIRQPR